MNNCHTNTPESSIRVPAGLRSCRQFGRMQDYGEVRMVRPLSMLGAGLCMAALLAGCASPYVTRPAAGPGDKDQAVSLSAALAYSRETRELYRAKIIELGESERALSNTLVSLGGALIAAGAFGAHRDTLVGGALIGGTAYSLGTFNTDKRRAMIYVAGMKALTCSDHAVTALNFDNTVAARMKENVASITVRLKRVTDGISTVEDLAKKISADATTLVQAETQAARQALGEAISAQGAADQLIAQRSIAGGRLRTVVDDIDTVILDAIRGTEGALEAVPQIIGGLVKASQVFAPQVNLADVIKPVPAEAPHSIREKIKKGASDKTKEALQNLDDAVASLNGEVVLLKSEAQRLNSLVATFDAAKAIDALKICRVEGLPATMKVDSTELKFKAKTADKKTVVIEGGKAPYYAYIEGSPAGISVENPQSQVLIVSVTDQVAAGNYRLIVQDNTRQTRLVVTIEVAENTKSNGDATKNDPIDQLVTDINALKTIRVGTTAVAISADRQGDQKKVAVSYSLPAGSTITMENVRDAVMLKFKSQFGRVGNEIVTFTQEADSPHSGGRSRLNGFVATLARDDLKTVQKQICLTGRNVDGLWGPTTQGALDAYRAKRREAGIKDVSRGSLTPAEFAQLSADVKAGKPSMACLQ